MSRQMEAVQKRVRYDRRDATRTPSPTSIRRRHRSHVFPPPTAPASSHTCSLIMSCNS